MPANASVTKTSVRSARRWWFEIIVVLAVTALIQFLLHGSSFFGYGVLLPVNALKIPQVYDQVRHDRGVMPTFMRSDLILVGEPNRWFMAAEYRAGRIPLWNPHIFGGTPFARAPIFSPFELLYVLWPSPLVLPWIQLASSCVGAVGAWLFTARILNLGSLPSVVTGIAYPMIGFLTLWQGFDLTHSLTVFPWELFAAVLLLDRVTVFRITALALMTAFEIVAGQVDMAGQALLATGLIWLWQAAAQVLKSRRLAMVMPAALATCTGWLLGFLLAAPLLLPIVEYLQTSSRVAERASGSEIRPPAGLKALPLVLFPEVYGSICDESTFVMQTGDVNQFESAAGAYCSIAAFLFALPWAFQDQARRRWVWCYAILSIVGLSWQLDLPGLVDIWRLPGLRILSANRFVFLTAWCVTMLAAIGLEQFSRSELKSIPWSMSWAWLLVVICIYGCVCGIVGWPDLLAQTYPKGSRGLTVADLTTQFVQEYSIQLGWILATAVCWILALVRRKSYGKVAWIVGLLMVVDPVSHAWNLHPQPDVSQYYPRLPILEYIQKGPAGRTIGMKCFPPRVLESHGLFDLRGYDGVDPKMLIDVLKISTDEPINPTHYSQTSDYAPLVLKDEKSMDKVRLHPTLNMLGLRYLICPIRVPGAVFADENYTLVVNQDAMPRAWVPEEVFERSTEDAVLVSITPWEFDPGRQAFVTNRADDIPEKCSGEVELTSDNPQRLTLSATMKTTGLVVVGDRYDSSWVAIVDGKQTPLLRVNYILRGVIVPEGQHSIEVVYRPRMFVLGVRLFQAAMIVLLGLGGWYYIKTTQCFSRQPAVTTK